VREALRNVGMQFGVDARVVPVDGVDNVVLCEGL